MALKKLTQAKLTFVLTSVLAHPQVYSADQFALFDDKAPVVLSATRLAQPQVEAPAAITIIDQRLIKASGAKSIPELFRLVPGMHVSYYRGNRAAVGYQGLTSEYPQGVQVLIDGQSTYSPLFGGINWANFPLAIEDIQQIEVIRGPNNASFGSNAFQSVINITTTHSSQLSGVEVKSTLGERGYERTSFRTAGHFGDLDIKLSASHYDDNGYDQQFDDTRQDMLNIRADYQLTAQDSLQFNISALDTLRGTQEPVQPDPLDLPRDQSETHFSIHSKWTRHLSVDEKLTAQVSYINFDSNDTFSSQFVDAEFGLGLVDFHSDNSSTYERWDFEFEHQFKPSDNTRLVWGLGLREDTVSLPLWFGTTDDFDNSLQRMFANVEWRVYEDLIANVGALVEHTSVSGTQASPRLALNYSFTPNHGLRFIASRAYRTPVLVEQNFNNYLTFETGVGTLDVPVLFPTDEEIKPEAVNSFELGYHGHYFENALTIDLKAFRSEYSRLIDTEDVNNKYQLRLNGAVPPFPLNGFVEARELGNRYGIDINGAELEINYRPSKTSLLHLGYSYNHIKEGAEQEARESIPQNTFNVLASQEFDAGYWASIGYYYTGRMEYKNSGNPQESYKRLDLNAGKTFKFSNQQTLDLNLTLQLALDQNVDFLREFTGENRAFIEFIYTYQ